MRDLRTHWPTRDLWIQWSTHHQCLQWPKHDLNWVTYASPMNAVTWAEMQGRITLPAVAMAIRRKTWDQDCDLEPRLPRGIWDQDGDVGPRWRREIWDWDCDVESGTKIAKRGLGQRLPSGNRDHVSHVRQDYDVGWIGRLPTSAYFVTYHIVRIDDAFFLDRLF